jgi:hypothetical protein
MKSARFYPIGYPVDIQANFEPAIEAAAANWAHWPSMFAATPLTLAIDVYDGDRPVGAQRFEARAGCLRFSCGETDFAEFDVAAKVGRMRIASGALDDGICFRHHWLETLVLTALDSVFFTPLHAACVARNGSGTLLCGDSGAGKSTLAYACARRGWTLVSDDSVHLVPGLGRIGVGGSRRIRLREPAKALFDELSGYSAKRTPNGKSAIEIDALSSGLQTARRAVIDRCVFLQRRSGSARLSPFPLEEAVGYFLKYLLPRETTRAERHLREALTSEPLLLEYEDVEEAVEALA